MCALITCALSAYQSAQTIYYVDNTNPQASDDSAHGTSKAFPYRTINYAVNNAAGGDTINVLPGTYSEPTITITQDGLKLEALPNAKILSQTPIGIVFDSSQGPISQATLLRGFEIQFDPSAGIGGIGIQAHDATSSFNGNELSPTIEENRVRNFSHAIDLRAVGADPTSGAGPSLSAPTIRHNYLTGGEPCSNGNFLEGISLNSDFNSQVSAHIQGNTIFGFEIGISLSDDSFSAASLNARCEEDVIAFCDYGVVALATAVAELSNETIALGVPTGGTSNAVVADSPNVSVVNSILWIPKAGPGVVSPCLLPGPFDDSTDINGSLALLGPETFVEDSGSPDPQFADVNGLDFRLAGTSPALEAGDNSWVLPGSTFEGATDRAGGPRVLDSDRNGLPVVDLGAFEFTTVDLQVDSAYGGAPVEDPIYRDVQYDAEIGLTAGITLTMTGLAGDIGILAVSRHADVNTFMSPWGNFLVDSASPLYITLSPLPGPSATLSLPTTFGFFFPEIEFDAQALYFDSISGLGNFSRRIVIEINQ